MQDKYPYTRRLSVSALGVCGHSPVTRDYSLVRRPRSAAPPGPPHTHSPQIHRDLNTYYTSRRSLCVSSFSRRRPSRVALLLVVAPRVRVSRPRLYVAAVAQAQAARPRATHESMHARSTQVSSHQPSRTLRRPGGSLYTSARTAPNATPACQHRQRRSCSDARAAPRP